jgi:hypothetical protein
LDLAARMRTFGGHHLHDTPPMKNILEADDRAAVMARILRVRPDSERRWGRMTPHQMVCHLTDAFETMVGEREAVDTGTPFTRTVMRFAAVNLPIRWPRGVRTAPEVDQEIGGTPPGVFEADLEHLSASVDAFVARVDPVAMRHPFLGRMSRSEWGRWGYRHVDHHARQFDL